MHIIGQMFRKSWRCHQNLLETMNGNSKVVVGYTVKTENKAKQKPCIPHANKWKGK